MQPSTTITISIMLGSLAETEFSRYGSTEICSSDCNALNELNTKSLKKWSALMRLDLPEALAPNTTALFRSFRLTPSSSKEAPLASASGSLKDVAARDNVAGSLKER